MFLVWSAVHTVGLILSVVEWDSIWGGHVKKKPRFLNRHSHFKISLSQNEIKSNFRIPHKLSAVGAKFSKTKHKSVPAET